MYASIITFIIIVNTWKFTLGYLFCRCFLIPQDCFYLFFWGNLLNRSPFLITPISFHIFIFDESLAVVNVDSISSSENIVI